MRNHNSSQAAFAGEDVRDESRLTEFTPPSGRATKAELLNVARLREAFLSDPTTDLTGVRPLVARSWIRSHAAGAAATARREAFEQSRVDEQTMRIAATVLEELRRMARDAGGYVTMVAPSGVLVGDPGGRPRDGFDPGYVLREEYCGTNGDGTALEEGHSLWIHSKEHYSDDMQETSCYTALVRDPYRGHVRAALGLTLPESVALDTDSRAATLTVEGYAAAISRELAARSSQREQALFGEYLRATRLYGKLAVIAVDGKTNIMSDRAVQLLGEGDYGVIASYAQHAIQARTSVHHDVVLSGERNFRLEITPAGEVDEPAGAIVLLREAKLRARKRASAAARHEREKAGGEGSHGLSSIPNSIVGASPAFAVVCRAVETSIFQRSSVHLLGEGGVGKTEFARVIAAGLGGDVTTVDCTALEPRAAVERVAEAVQRSHVSLLRRVDTLSAEAIATITGLFADRDHAPVILTLRRPTSLVAQLIGELGSSEVAIPPLRMRRDDIPPLVQHLLAEVTQKLPSPRLLAALIQADWPGNIPQLRAVVRDAAAKAEGPSVSLGDLPQGFQRVTGPGRLSRLEEAEMHVLRAALEEASGNRSLAADILQIGRSTLYRRLDFYQRRGISI